MLFCLFLLIPLGLFAQKQKDWIELGDGYMADNEYAQAAAAYQEGMMLDSTNFDLTVKYAESLRLSRDYNRALWYYGKIYGKDRGQLFPEGQFHLAAMQKLNGDYKAALRNYKSYLDRVKRDKKSYFYLKAKQEIESCTFALKARRDSNLIILSNLPKEINSTSADFAGALDQDSIFYFNSFRDDRSKLYSCVLSDSLGSGLKVEEHAVNSKDFAQGSVCFFPAEDKVVFSRCSAVGECNLYQADIYGDEWKNVTMLSAVNEAGASSTMPHLAQIGKDLILFFASNRAEGEGKLDIYWSQYNNGSFGKAINAGSAVNSIDNEISPFYFNGALYFSSDWHEGLGGFDIFSSLGMPRSFSKPENLGFPFNTNANDLYWTYYPSVHKGFISSNRVGSYIEESEICCNDIYQFQYPDSISTESELPYANLDQLNDYLPVTLYFHNDEPDPRTLDTLTSIRYDESYASYTKRLDEYLKEVVRGLSGDRAQESRYETEEFFSLYVDKGMEDLKVFSKLLIRELRKGSEIELSVKGFASPRAKSDYNLNLTKRRITSLENYLRHYEEGVFIPFFESRDSTGGSLKIVQIPFGEYQADQTVSDVLENERESIYNKSACLERKIEIRSVQRAPEDSTKYIISASSLSFDFGIISEKAGIQETSFKLINKSDEAVSIESIESPCGCTVALPEAEEILPGQEVRVAVQFDPLAKLGIQSKTIQISLSNQQEPILFTISSEVIK